MVTNEDQKKAVEAHKKKELERKDFNRMLQSKGGIKGFLFELVQNSPDLKKEFAAYREKIHKTHKS